MAAWRRSLRPGLREEMCSSCFTTTRYYCIGCEIPICNRCSVAEINEETPAWATGKSVGYCEPCTRDKNDGVGGRFVFLLVEYRFRFSNIRILIASYNAPPHTEETLEELDGQEDEENENMPKKEDEKARTKVQVVRKNFE